MKIEQSSLKVFSTELPPECATFISKLKRRGTIIEFAENLDMLTEWYSALGKTEMGRWFEVLNDCDEILENAVKETQNSVMTIDVDDSYDRPVISILRFTSLLFENSFSRSVYSSMGHLLKLLDCRKMNIVVQTLRLFLVISKSSRYITQHLLQNDKLTLYIKLTANTESWNGKLRGIKMSECFDEKILKNLDLKTITYRTTTGIKTYIVDIDKPFDELKTQFLKCLSEGVEESEKFLSLAKLRLAINFSCVTQRLYCVMSRLLSISILFYSRCLLDEWRINCLINDDLIEQISNLLQLEVPTNVYQLDGVKTEALKTLASIVFLEKPRKIQLVVDSLGLSSYHGFTSSLIRSCVEKLRDGAIDLNSEFSAGFVTALFSLVYHIAGFDYGGESLISLVPTLLGMVKACNLPDAQISFVTRAVRIIDILTGIDVTEFNNNDGINFIVDRFVYEVNVCKKTLSDSVKSPTQVCHQQRAALIKSLLNFLKRAIADTNYATQIRRIMEGELPIALINIIENPLFYGSSLVHCAMHLTIGFIYQEPAQLTFLQDIGLTDALMKLIFDDNFPISRDNVVSLPNICSAVCLNEHGLKAFNQNNPLERIFRIIFSSKFVLSQRKRKTETLEATSAIGGFLDELMRHQPTLRKPLLTAFVTILDEILCHGIRNEKNFIIFWFIGKAGALEEEHLKRVVNDAKLDADAQNRNDTNEDKKAFQICYEQNGVTILPLGDYIAMIGSLLESMLTNRGTQENSSLIIECGIPLRLIKLLSFERPSTPILSSTYLPNLSNILRHIVSQTNKIEPFDTFISNLLDALKAYESYKADEDTNSPEKMFILTRIISQLLVLNNFMKGFLNNAQDMRFLLLNYFATNETGKAFIKQLFATFMNMNQDLLFFNKIAVENAKKPSAASTSMETNETTPITKEDIPASTVANDADNQSKLKKPDASSEEYTINSMIIRAHKHLSELIVYLGKTFCNLGVRHRRGLDSQVIKDTHLITEELFNGITSLLQLNSELSEYFSCGGIYICHVLSILKKLLFDDYQVQMMMLPFFFKSGTHKAFFEVGASLVTLINKEELGVVIMAWLSVLQKLICVNNMLTQKNKIDQRCRVEDFEQTKYLALCQHDAIVTLAKFFKYTIQSTEGNKKDENKFLDKIITLFQTLIRGVVYLNDLKRSKEPAYEVLIHEIDTDKVQSLVEMGFSQSDALDALLQHNSVPEAAEYLIGIGNTQATRTTFPRTQSDLQTSATNATSTINEEQHPLTAIEEEAHPIESSTLPENDASSLSENILPDKKDNEPKKGTEGMNIDAPILSKFNSTKEINNFEDLKNISQLDLKEVIDFICKEIVPDCFAYVSKDQLIVFGVAELLSIFINDPLATDWTHKVLITKLIADLEDLMLQISTEKPNVDIENRFASLLLLFCLLWKDIEDSKIYSLLKSGFYEKVSNILFKLFANNQELIDEHERMQSKLFPPILLCMDMYEKEKRVDQRQKIFVECTEKVKWYYWVNEERFGSNSEWRDYSPVCSAQLNKAFREGKSMVRLVINEKHVVVDFMDMVQRDINNSSVQPVAVYAKAKLNKDFDINTIIANENSLNSGLDIHKKIISKLLELLRGFKTPLTSELAYSALSLLLRMVSFNGMIPSFVEAQGIETLIKLETRDKMPLLSTAISLLLRSCIDDSETLENGFEQIIRAIEDGVLTSLSELSSRPWMGKSKRHMKEWRRVMRLLSPLAARNVQAYINVMENNFVLKAETNDLELKIPDASIELTSKSKGSAEGTLFLSSIIKALTTELLSTDFSKSPNRVLTSASLLKLLAEFLASYVPAATILVEETFQDHSIIFWIIDKFLLTPVDSSEVVLAAKAVLTKLISYPLSTKANEILINEIKTLLCLTLVDKKENVVKTIEISEKVSILARLIMLLRECTQANAVTSRNKDVKQQYALIRYIHKRSLAVDFAKCIWHLPLNEKRASDAINIILKLFESIARDLTSINIVRTPPTQQQQQPVVPSNVSANETADPVTIPSETDATQPQSNSEENPPVNVEDRTDSILLGMFEEALLPENANNISSSSSSDFDDSNEDAVEAIIDREFDHTNAPNLGEHEAHGSHGENSSDSEETASGGSDGVDGNVGENSDGEIMPNGNVIDGIRMRHRQLDPQIRTSTPISEDELEHEHEIVDIRHDRVLDETQVDDDETQGDDDEDEEDEEMNDDEVLVEPDDDDVSEFEEVLTEYLDAVDIVEARNEFRDVVPHNIISRFSTQGGRQFAIPGGHRTGGFRFTHTRPIAAGGHGSSFGVPGVSHQFPSNVHNFMNSNSMPFGIPNEYGIERTRLLENREVGEAAVQHPLLRRPQTSRLSTMSQLLTNVSMASGAAMGVTGHPTTAAFAMNELQRSNHNANDAENPNNIQDVMHNDVALQRLMIHRLASNNRRSQGLRRQGALRRWHPLGNGANQLGSTRQAARFLTRIIDESLFPEMNVYRPYDIDSSREASSDRRLIEAFVPYYLDRIFDQTQLLDAQSVHYVSIVVAAYLSEKLLVKPIEKKEVSKDEVSESNEDILNTAIENREESNNQEQRSAGEESMDTELSNRLAVLANPTLDISESTPTIDSTPASNIADTNPDSDTLANTASNQVQMEVDSSSSAVEPTIEHIEPTLSIQAEPTTVTAEPTQDQQPPNAINVEIPDGVDPAFLAALPDDIRQEVLRDYRRQQRAQRITEAQTQQRTTNVPSNSVAASDNQPESFVNPNFVEPTTVQEEVLDQEFLAALPPELQEEVLAQHEQRIAQRNRQNTTAVVPTTAADANNASAVDIDAVFESLPPGLRAQVLADADDSVLQILPPNLLAEANRLRANFEQQQVFRFARMLDRPMGIRSNNHQRSLQQPSNINSATSNSEERGVQIFDRESIVTIMLLYFLDHEKFSLLRIQKLLKPLCLHSGTCDYIIWCLISMLNVLINNDLSDDDSNVLNNGWIDGFQIQTALNQPEKVLRLFPENVRVHQLVKNSVCTRILDTLVFLARNFPYHFLPNKIRVLSNSTKRWNSVPDLKHFWDIVRSINKKKEDFKPCTKSLSQIRDILPNSLEQSPMAYLLKYLDSALVKNNGLLMDKLMRILHSVASAAPSDCQQKISEDSVKWMINSLEGIANIILDNCMDEGLKDGRMFLLEVLRILPTQRSVIFAMLFETVKDQGMRLNGEINQLLEELALLKLNKHPTSSTVPVKATSSAEALIEKDSSKTNKAKMIPESDMQLATLKKFTSRNSQPKKFLKSLETISYLQKQIEKRRKQTAQGESTTQASVSLPTDSTQASTSTGTPSATITRDSNAEIPQEQSTPIPTSSMEPSTSNAAEPISEQKSMETEDYEEKNLEDMHLCLQPLWNSLSICLEEMSQLLDTHAVISLQHAAEAFFLAHAFSITQKASTDPSSSSTAIEHPSSSPSQAVQSTYGPIITRLDTNKHAQNMFEFAEKHRTVLNQILRGNSNNLMEDSAFAILSCFPKLLDFDVKRKYFYKEIRQLDDRSRFRHEDVAVRIRRKNLFSDSFRELFRLKGTDWKARFYIIFEGEEGQDAGGLLREWYSIITRDVFNPNYALFITAPGDRVTYMINKSSYINPEHLDYFKFVGRIIAKAIYDNKQLDCYFTRAFYKHILNVAVRYQDIESEDPSYFKSLEFLLSNPIEDLGTELTFSVEVEEFGVRSMRQLKENGLKIPVTDQNKEEYVQLVCQMKMTGSIRKQLDAFLEGFYDIIPKKLISIFNEQELELLISGLPEIDIDDLCNNTEYKSFNRSSPQIQWFWRALRSFEHEDLAKFLQFVTGTSKVPLQGFSHLEGMNGIQKFTIHMDTRSTDRLPCAHTCFNQLDLPQYESYEQLRRQLLMAIRECSEGFAFA